MTSRVVSYALSAWCGIASVAYFVVALAAGPGPIGVLCLAATAVLVEATFFHARR